MLDLFLALKLGTTAVLGWNAYVGEEVPEAESTGSFDRALT